MTSPDENTHVGQITKQWSGLAKEVFTDADNFGVTFPMDLDVKAKATTLGAVFLIVSFFFSANYILFETSINFRFKEFIDIITEHLVYSSKIV